MPEDLTVRRHSCDGRVTAAPLDGHTNQLVPELIPHRRLERDRLAGMNGCRLGNHQEPTGGKRWLVGRKIEGVTAGPDDAEGESGGDPEEAAGGHCNLPCRLSSQRDIASSTEMEITHRP